MKYLAELVKIWQTSYLEVPYVARFSVFRWLHMEFWECDHHGALYRADDMVHTHFPGGVTSGIVGWSDFPAWGIVCASTTLGWKWWKHPRPWWRHQMETFSASLALCAGNSPFTGEFPSQRPVTQSFDVFFDLRLTKWLCKQWRFKTLSRSLWRHCNDHKNGRLSRDGHCWR